MLTKQLVLDLDYSMCEPLKLIFKRKAIKRIFGSAPKQITFKFKLISTKKSLFKRATTQLTNLVRRLIKACKTL